MIDRKDVLEAHLEKVNQSRLKLQVDNFQLFKIFLHNL